MSTPADGNASDRSDEPFGGRENDQWPGYGSSFGAQHFGAGGHSGRFEPGQYGEASFYGADQAYGAQQPYGMQPYGMQPYGQMYGAMQHYGVQPYGQYPPAARKEPALMLVASLLVPGLGTMLNGRVGKGLGILGGYFVGLVLSVVLIGLPIMFGFWIWGMIDAYQGAKDHNARHGLP